MYTIALLWKYIFITHRMYYNGKRSLYPFFIGRAMFLQEWAMGMNTHVPFYQIVVGHGQLVVSLHKGN